MTAQQADVALGGAGAPVVTVRYFAAAGEAAGRASESLAARTVGELRAAMVSAHGPMLERVLDRSALLVRGERADDAATPLLGGETVDVLPPFAGG